MFSAVLNRFVRASRLRRTAAFCRREFGGALGLERKWTVSGNGNERGPGIMIGAQTTGDVTGLGTTSHH